MRAVSILTFACALVVGSAQANATSLHGELPQPDDEYRACSQEAAEVLKWAPANGPLGNFLADAFEQHSSLWIGLGYDDKGFWSAEADSGSDACDSCGKMSLVRTSFDGKERTSFLIGKGYDQEPGTPGERRKKLKQRVFKVAAGELDVKALKHDYKLNLPKHDADGKMEKFSGWFAEVKKKDGSLLRYALVSESFMCWCHPSWRAYTLAAPKKK